MATQEQGQAASSLEAIAHDRARALARAIGESPPFQAFEAAQEALLGNAELQARLDAYRSRLQDLQTSRAWGGADRLAEEALEEEWDELSATREVRSYLHAQEALTAFLRQVATIITRETGLDFGAACSPAGGCCLTEHPMDPQHDGFERVAAMTRDLADALRATPTIAAYRQAEARFRSDPQLRLLREEFERVAQTFREAQARSTVTQAQVRQVREVQTRLQRHPLVQEFLAARDAAGRLLQEVNRAMSEVLGLDVGATVGPAGGAC